MRLDLEILGQQGEVMTFMRIVELVQAFRPCGGCAEKKQKKTMKGFESNSLKEGQFILNYS